MGKTTCTAPYRVGYAYSWKAGQRSTLTCRECGLPDTAHETLREQVERTGREVYGED